MSTIRSSNLSIGESYKSRTDGAKTGEKIEMPLPRVEIVEGTAVQCYGQNRCHAVGMEAGHGTDPACFLGFRCGEVDRVVQLQLCEESGSRAGRFVGRDDRSARMILAA
jgi:hypothetical protein